MTIKGQNFLSVFLACSFFVLYAVCAQRDISWQDSGLFQLRILSGDYAGVGGVALAHPGYIFGARIFSAVLTPILASFGFSEFFAPTLFSAFGMSLAIFLIFRLVLKLTGRVSAATLGAIVLGFSHMAWWLSSVAEVYTWSLALMMAELTLLREASLRHEDFRPSFWLFFVNGIHFAFHNFALLNLPIYLVLSLASLRRTSFARAVVAALLCGVAFMAGSAAIWTLALREISVRGLTLAQTISETLFGIGYADVVLGIGRTRFNFAVPNFAIASLSLAAPGFVFVVPAMTRSLVKERGFRRALIGLTIIHVVFWVRYFVPDQATFLLPTLGLLALWAGIGAASMRPKNAVALALTGILAQTLIPVFASIILHHTSAARIASARTRQLPGRDEISYWILPWKCGEMSAANFRDQVIDEMPDGRAVLYADATAWPPLKDILRSGAGDFDLYSQWDKSNAIPSPHAKDGRKFFTVTPKPGYCPQNWLKGNMKFTRRGVLWQVSHDGNATNEP